MSDLNTRIAAAIKEIDDMRACKLSNADIKFMADAVIRELGLQRHTGHGPYRNTHWYQSKHYFNE